MIGFEGKQYHLPSVESRTLSNRIKTFLADLKTGRVADEFGWNLKV